MYQEWELEAAEEAYESLMEYEEDQSHIVWTRKFLSSYLLTRMLLAFREVVDEIVCPS